MKRYDEFGIRTSWTRGLVAATKRRVCRCFDCDESGSIDWVEGEGMYDPGTPCSGPCPCHWGTLEIWRRHGWENRIRMLWQLLKDLRT